MTTLKGIKGDQIRYLDADPPNPIEGQMWFNSTTQTLKGAVAGGAPVGTWASGNTMNNGRYRMQGGAGSINAGLIVGGYAPSIPGASNYTESYNGTSWATAPSYPGNFADIGTAGTLTAAISAGGNGAAPGETTTVSEWNGSSWTAGTGTPAPRARMQVLGAQTAALGIGGAQAGTYQTTTLVYNGTSWTTGGTYDTALANGGCSGPSTAAFSFGGYTPSASTQAAQYNGTSWTETTSLNTARSETMFSGSGTQTSSMISQGGSPYATLVTEAWNGTAWTEIADIALGRSAGGSFGTTSAMVNCGGTVPTPAAALTATEEFVAPDLVIKTVTTS